MRQNASDEAPVNVMRTSIQEYVPKNEFVSMI